MHFDNEKYDALHVFALRLLDRRHRHGAAYPRSHPSEPPELFVGVVPPDLGVDIPLPDGSRILGTVRMKTHSEILLDVPLPTRRVLRFYEEELGACGWIAHHAAGNRWNGFQSHTQEDVTFGQFDQGLEGPALNVVAVRDGEMTDLSLYLNTQPAPPPRPYRGDHRPRPMDSCIPALAAPPRSIVEHQGGQFGPERADSLALITSELDMAAVNQHYVTQLRDAGWALVRQEGGEEVIWTTWRFSYKGHAYSALMAISRTIDGQFDARIHAERGQSS